MLTCRTPWTHAYGWPQRGVQTCARCGQTRQSAVEIDVNPRFDVPRYDPKAHEVADRRKVVKIGRRKSAS